MIRLTAGLALASALTCAVAAHAANATYGQQLLSRYQAKHPEISGLAVVARTKGAAEAQTVASTFAAGGPGKGAVRVPLFDASRRPVGELAVGFRAGGSEAKALTVRDALSKRILSTDSLVEPAVYDASVPEGSWIGHLIDTALLKHPQIAALAAHAAHDGKHVVIAGSSFGRIGKPGDDDDLEVINTGKSRLEVNATGDRYEVEEPLLDVAGDTIGAIGVVFPYVKGQDTTEYQRIAKAVQAEFSKHLISAKNLFDAYPYDPAYSERTFAQKLVEDTVAKHPEVIILATHSTKPGSRQNVISGSTIGRIGKKADEDDDRVIQKGATNLEIADDKKRFEVELPLNDAKGRRIGALGVVLAYKDGDDKEALHRHAIAIRDEMAARIPSAAALARPYS